MQDGADDIYATEHEEEFTEVPPGSLKRSTSPHTLATGAPDASRASKRVKEANTAVKRMKGQCPPFNDKSAWISDPANHRAFLLGGLPNEDHKEDKDKAFYPTSDFYCCDTASMRWTNLTDSLSFRTPENPFSDAEAYHRKAHLPVLAFPGCSLVRISGRSFIFMFGGYDPDAELSKSDVIVIDPDRLTWWYLKFEGDTVGPRINPAATSIGNDFLIFGGYEHFDLNSPGPCASYSVLSYNPGAGTWKWSIRDKLFPNIIPSTCAIGAAIPVYEGKKILLLPGRYTTNNQITFARTNVFFYHVLNDRFQFAAADIEGDFPLGMSWYCAYEYSMPTTAPPSSAHYIFSSNGSSSALSTLSSTPIPGKRPRGRPRKIPILPITGSNPNAPSLSQYPTIPNALISSANGKRPRGRPRKNPAAPSSVPTPSSGLNDASSAQRLYSSSSSPSVVICGWTQYGNTDELAPEIWHLFLSPDERVVCLDVAKQIWELDFDFQMFIWTEGKLRILGTDNLEDGQNRDPRYDIYADISL